MRVRFLEKWLVLVVAAHSLGVAVVLLAAPRWAASFGGWGELDSVFFVRQGGAFHLVVAIGYLQEYFRHRSVRLLLTAKGVAVVFLSLSWIAAAADPWAVPFAAVSDGLMGLAVFSAHRAAGRSS